MAEYEEEHFVGELQDLALEDPIERIKDYIEMQPFDTHAPQELQDAMPLPPIVHHGTVKTRLPSHKAQDSLHGSFNPNPSLEKSMHLPLPQRYFCQSRNTHLLLLTLKRNLQKLQPLILPGVKTTHLQHLKPLT